MVGVVSLVLLAAVVSYIPEVAAAKTVPQFGMRDIDINHHNSFWGILMDSRSGTPGWNIRAGIAHLLDKDRFVVDVMGGLDFSAGCGPEPRVMDNSVPRTTNLCADYHVWTSSELAQADPMHTTTSLYNLAPDAGGFAQPGSPDFCAAADHFLAAGIGTGKNPLTCVVQNVGSVGQIIFYINSVDSIRTQLGTGLSQAIEALMGGNYVNEILVTLRQATPVFDTTVPDDWHLYTARWRLDDVSPPKYLCNLYGTHGARVDGFETNYIFYSNVLFDAFACGKQFSTHGAQLVFGATVGTIPVVGESAS